MRNHGFEYKDPENVALDDWIVTEFRPLGESEHVRTPATAYRVLAQARISLGMMCWEYTFTLDGAFFPYVVADTAQVPVTTGPS